MQRTHSPGTPVFSDWHRGPEGCETAYGRSLREARATVGTPAPAGRSAKPRTANPCRGRTARERQSSDGTPGFNSLWQNPRGVRPAMHPARTTPLRSVLRCVSVEIHPVFLPHAPRRTGPHRENWASPLSALTRVPPPAVIGLPESAFQEVSGRSTAGKDSSLFSQAPNRGHSERMRPMPISSATKGPWTRLSKQPVRKPTRRSAGDPSRLNRVAARRSSLRFGRNTPGIPPSRALSAGPPPGELAPPGELGLPSLGAHPGSTTGCYPGTHRKSRLLGAVSDPSSISSGVANCPRTSTSPSRHVSETRGMQRKRSTPEKSSASNSWRCT